MWSQKWSAEDCVVPIKNYACLVGLRLLLWFEPYFFILQLGHELRADLVVWLWGCSLMLLAGRQWDSQQVSLGPVALFIGFTTKPVLSLRGLTRLYWFFLKFDSVILRTLPICLLHVLGLTVQNAQMCQMIKEVFPHFHALDFAYTHLLHC